MERMPGSEPTLEQVNESINRLYEELKNYDEAFKVLTGDKLQEMRDLWYAADMADQAGGLDLKAKKDVKEKLEALLEFLHKELKK